MICKDCIVNPICKIGCNKLDNMILKDFKNDLLIKRLLNRREEILFNFGKIIVKTNTICYFFYNIDRKLHREDGPAVEHVNENKIWYKNGELHREDGPAVDYVSGYKCWYKNGKLHREDGPAIEYASGDKEWYKNGKLHRED